MFHSWTIKVLTLSLVALSLTTTGCGKIVPAVTEVEGTLLLGNKPLPNALVEFQPEIEVGPEWISTGITDKDGKFTLTLEQKQIPGAAVCKHRIVVKDAPGPEGSRGMSKAAQEKMAEYKNSLQNRPIPPVYSTAGSTTAKIEVKADQHDYKIELTR